MSLEPLAEARPRAIFKTSMIVIGAWTLWLAFVSTLSYSSRLSLSGVAIVLIFGSFWWSVIEGGFFLLLMAWIFRVFSLTPPGLYWAALAIVFGLLKLASYRFSIRSLHELALFVFLTALLVDISQMFLLRQVSEIYVFRFSTLGFIFLSAILQTLLSFIFVRPLLILLASK